MTPLQSYWNIAWRSIVVAISYVIGLLFAGILVSMLAPMPQVTGGGSSFISLFIASVLLGIFLGPLASRMALTRRQHFVLWGSLIIFNLGSVAIEGAYFAPSLVSLPIPLLLTQQSLATAGASLAITFLFGCAGTTTSWMQGLRTRSWYSWVWRIAASGFSYLLLYFVFGGLNYSLVTKPYYETHAGGLTVPAPQVVLIIESIRGLLIVFSLLLFLLSARGTRRQLMLECGWLLFAIGGIIPLIWQINFLPSFLLLASAIEIFFQNFLTGAVAAQLLRIDDPARH